MPYSKQTIIYGIPLTRAADDLIDTWRTQPDPRYAADEKQAIVCGFTRLYHASAGWPFQSPGYAGVVLGKTDEARDYHRLDTINGRWAFKNPPPQAPAIVHDSAMAEQSFKYEPTTEQIEKAAKIVASIPTELRDLCPPIGIYVIFHTS